ncbi:transposase (plasmid) [Rhodococcus sp. USK10]|nr:transposase [Rhodococcus sp. USK10]
MRANVVDLLGHRSGGHPVVDLRRRWERATPEAVIYRYRAGIAWRDLPECSDRGRRCWRHRRFSGDGTWDKILTALLAGPTRPARSTGSSRSTPRSTVPISTPRTCRGIWGHRTT